MALPSPKLDDRDFAQLLREAHRRIRQSCPGWTDLSPGDPGATLVEVFAHLTEIMLYRLNRLPEKVHVELLNLLGVTLQPPAAATAELLFEVRQPAATDITIPAGTRVTVARAGSDSEPPVFTTARSATIRQGERTVRVRAYHAQRVEAERIGTGDGTPAQGLRTRHAPIVSAAAGGPGFLLGVEEASGKLPVGAPGLRHADRTYRIWQELNDFTEVGDDDHAFLLDRHQGRVQFAPALQSLVEGGDGTPALADNPRALAALPPDGTEVLAWYWHGGGSHGNVAAGTLTVLKDPVPGVTVTNPAAAVGGRAGESLGNAMLRGSQEIHSLKRAVTARDFELCALRTGAVARAYAYTKIELWHHAEPGTVEVLVLPHIPEREAGGPVTADLVATHCAANLSRLPEIQRELDLRRPLGTRCLVNWAHCKPVQVAAQVVTYDEEDPDAVRQRLLDRLDRYINPLPMPPEHAGWPSGQPLTSWQVYRILGEEPGVKAINRLRLCVDDVPDTDVTALVADTFERGTWYAGSRTTLYRTLNDGDGWEPIRHFPDERVLVVKPYDHRLSRSRAGAGLLAVATGHEHDRARIHLSRDCGETWELLQPTAFPVSDIAWIDRDGRPALLLAADRGLFELGIDRESDPLPLIVDPQQPGLGFYRVVVTTDAAGEPIVAVSARQERGVFVSTRAGRSGTFTHVGLDNRLVRVLAVQQRGPHRYLWAGIAAPGTDPGQGCTRLRLSGTPGTATDWKPFVANWATERAGGCLGLAFRDGLVFAATRNRGVLILDPDAIDPAWQTPGVDCGLPLRDIGRLLAVDTLATAPDGDLVLAAGRQGVYRSRDDGTRYTHCSPREFENEVTLPPSWYFCAIPHALEVVSEHGA
jgi:hypothetical protein